MSETSQTKSSGKSLRRKLTDREWSKSGSPRPGANTDCGRIPAIVERNEKPVDHRPFIVRLLCSIRISPKINLKGVHGVEIKGGTDL
jgi:hypothetical protein